jgi:hypothetical protein
MRARLIACAATTIAIAALVGACSSDPHGLPFGVDFVNWTDQTLTIVDIGGGSEEVLVASLDPRSVAGLSMAGDEFGRCSRGEYVARDASGQEIARHPDEHCHDWAVTLSPVEFTITNTSTEPVEIVYQAGSIVVIAPNLAPGEAISGTVDKYGDPSDVCTGGVLAARPVGQRSVQTTTLPQYDRSIPKQFVNSCGDWSWAVQGCPTSPPPGVVRPSDWPTDVPWPPCS